MERQQEERTLETKWVTKTILKQHKCTSWNYKEARETRGIIIYEIRIAEGVNRKREKGIIRDRWG